MVLQILVVGGGLAGLATAVTLRRAGHKVKVFEVSQLAFGDTVGPVVHLGPKSNELLEQWELDRKVTKGVLIKEISEFDQDGTLKSKGDQSQRPGWEYYDRSQLHKALLDSAVASTGLGDPVEIFHGTKVISADPDTAKITLEDGRTFQGDIVIAADGLHSVIRQTLFDNETISNGPPKAAIHFRVDVTNIGHNSVVQRFQDQPERYEKWIGGDLQLSVYVFEPTSVLFECTIPISKQTEDQEQLTPNLLQENIMKTFESAHPDFLQLLKGVDTKDVYFWTQESLPRVDKWTSKRLVLIGDAAHPFLPYEPPGTAQSLNDALALATELKSDVAENEIEERLIAWEKPRQDRVKTIQQMERKSWSSI